MHEQEIVAEAAKTVAPILLFKVILDKNADEAMAELRPR
jgi:hypothetical protein